MIKKILNIGISLAAMFTLATPVLIPATVYAQSSGDQIQKGLCAGAQLNANLTETCDPVDDTVAREKINDIIAVVINIFSLVVGVIAVIMIIIGGLKYITSGGDSGNVTSAKNTILYAIVGLVIVALAQFIVRFVLSRISSTP